MPLVLTERHICKPLGMRCLLARVHALAGHPRPTKMEVEVQK